jgi:inosine/xanthosine triphosphatase
MLIVVGSLAPPKVDGTREVIVDEYASLFPNADVIGVEVETIVTEQPRSLEETIRGAEHRALMAKKIPGAAYGVGIEDGLMPFPSSRTGYVNICVCKIYDGKDFAQGTSSGYESPVIVTKHMIEDGLDMSTAWKHAGLYRGGKIGHEQGSIGVLTRGRVDRKRYTKEAIRMALLQLENRELYR